MKSAHERASNRVPRIQKQTLELDGRSVPGRSFVAAKKVILPTRSREHFHTRTAFAESFFFHEARFAMRLVARHTSSSCTPFCLETSLIRRPSSPTARGVETAGPGTDGLDKHARKDVARDKLSNVGLKAKKPACIWVAWWRNGKASDL